MGYLNTSPDDEYNLQTMAQGGNVTTELMQAVQHIGPARMFSKDRLKDATFVGKLFIQLGIKPLPPL